MFKNPLLFCAHLSSKIDVKEWIFFTQKMYQKGGYFLPLFLCLCVTGLCYTPVLQSKISGLGMEQRLINQCVVPKW